MKGSSYRRIHSDYVALLLGDRLVSLFDHTLDPIDEWILDDRSDHVADPFLGDLLDLLLIGQVIVDMLVAMVKMSCDVLERQTLVLRDRNVPNVLALYHCNTNTNVNDELNVDTYISSCRVPDP